MDFFVIWTVIVLIGVAGTSCSRPNVAKDCSLPSECAPFHHAGGHLPAPNIMKPLDKGQTVRVFPAK